ncbi:hypothetical protein KI387_026476 [Taxus chinensis]|uniref:Cupin type-1 domain-containing protein n=1 Tax=Taxus chinensis TaxID=29808 RepID=A0AA38FW22_TAXCH|nr:hypothetical protein KI387_026476 [Taxus chinensis]
MTSNCFFHLHTRAPSIFRLILKEEAEPTAQPTTTTTVFFAAQFSIYSINFQYSPEAVEFLTEIKGKPANKLDLVRIMASWGELILLLSMFITSGIAHHHHSYGHEESDRSMFLMRKSKQLIKTEAGEVRVLKREYKPEEEEEEEEEEGRRIKRGQLDIGFITMEPKSFFLPQFLNSDFVFLIERGSARLGWVHNRDLIEQNLKIGDVYRIPGGSVFYLINTDEGQRLHIIFSVDTSQSLIPGKIQSFFVAGGLDPVSVLSGFDDRVLSGAFNVSRSEVESLLSGQSQGPILYITERQWESLMPRSNYVHGRSWQWSFLLQSFLNPRKKTAKKFDSFNILDKNPDFKNDYGWSIAVSNDDYSSLNEPDIGLFYVNLSAGAMMAHHYNPRGSEYGIITRGEGRIQIAFPNGTSGMDMDVKVGDVFWVPQYYPVCQIAARSGPLEFFGFTTSARGNRPQFLTGKNSVFNIMGSRNLATAFNISEKRVRDILGAQTEAVILPPLNPKKEQEEEEETETGTERQKKETERERKGGEGEPQFFNILRRRFH